MYCRALGATNGPVRSTAAAGDNENCTAEGNGRENLEGEVLVATRPTASSH
jgi:hypothetical protein